MNFGLGVEVTEGGEIFNWKMGRIWTDQLEIKKTAICFVLSSISPTL